MKLTSFLLVLVHVASFAQTEINPKIKPDADKQFVTAEVEKRATTYKTVASHIWEYAELGYQETRSSDELINLLRSEGFKIEQGVAGMPTAFTATYGSGGPVIGILAEFDALPGLSQKVAPAKDPLIEGKPGHGCGHNLFGTASSAAAISLKEWLAKNKKAGTIRLYGTPAEEGGGAKMYMIRDGLFNDVDVVLHWHPSNRNDASPESCMAIKQGLFRFYGKSSHAAGAPEKGRSALDGVESMNYMVNMMREHMPTDARIHYVITKGGLAANVVPDYAEVEYMVRNPDARILMELWDRVVKCGEGAATGTETTMKFEVISGSYNILPNETLAKLMYNNLKNVGGVNYSPEDVEFAKKLQSSFTYKAPDIAEAGVVQPFKPGGFFPASTDVGDVSWVVPTVGLGTATFVPGAPGHSWQAVATANTDIGMKGMLNAAKALAMTGIDLFRNPQEIEKAKKELKDRTGAGFQYKPLIGDRKPPVEYRK